MTALPPGEEENKTMTLGKQNQVLFSLPQDPLLATGHVTSYKSFNFPAPRFPRNEVNNSNSHRD